MFTVLYTVEAHELAVVLWYRTLLVHLSRSYPVALCYELWRPGAHTCFEYAKHICICL